MRKKLYHGNCLEVLATLPANKIDTCITDPPYELGFMNKDWDSAGVSFQKETWEAVYRVLKPGALLLAFGGTRTVHRIAVAIEDAGFEIRDTICWLYGQGFPKSYNISKGIDKKAKKEREIIGKRKHPTLKDTIKIEEQANAAHGNNKWAREWDITAPATSEAELWEGWGTALKPSHEDIIIAMKPLDGTNVNNALTHGVAGMWIDGGRIPTGENENLARSNKWGDNGWKNSSGGPNTAEIRKLDGLEPQGRWPANTILDEEASQMLDEQTGIQKGGFVRNRTDGARPFENDGEDTGYETVAEISEPDGGASRFFYCAKAAKKERNAGVEKNSHATVKPLALMEYLCKLTRTPTGGIVLDPFMGSGTTGMACVNTDRDFIGIELVEEHYEIARRRINHAKEILKID